MSTQLERPKTGRGSRSHTSNIPPRPTSRHGGFHEDPYIDSDEEGHGRPASRVGFSPELPYRYSHDEYSRQHSIEGRQEFPGNFPNAADDRLEYQQYRNQPGERFSISPTPGDTLRQSPQFGRYSKESPVHRDLYRQSPQYSQMLRIHGDDGSHGQQRPSSQENPKLGSPGQREPYQQSPQSGRTFSGDHYSPQSPSAGDARYSPYREAYQDSYQHSQNSYTHRESNQAEPQYVDTQYEQEEQYPDQSHQDDVRYSRPPTGQRPKSARPKTARKKTAKQRQKKTDESPPQQQAANQEQPAFLAAGDPYGRPSSSLSRYKPLPAIGTKKDQRDQKDTSVSQMTSQAQVLSLEDKYETKDSKDVISHTSKVQGNVGIPGGSSFYRSEAADLFEPSGVSVLTDFPKHLSNEIFKSSLASFEKGLSEEREVEKSESDEKEFAHSNRKNSSVAGLDNSNEDLIRPLLMKHKLPLEPDSDEKRVLLAIRLPDGKRHQHYFRPSEPLEDVLFFIENESGLDFSAFNLACNTPKCVFDDLTMSINDAKLQDRTVLYLEQR